MIQNNKMHRHKKCLPRTQLVIFIHRLLLANLETLGLFRQKILVMAGGRHFGNCDVVQGWL
jgi:hypothetical protein